MEVRIFSTAPAAFAIGTQSPDVANQGFRSAFAEKKSGPLQSKLIAMLTDLPKTAITMASTENLLKSVMFFDHAEGAENAMA